MLTSPKSPQPLHHIGNYAYHYDPDGRLKMVADPNIMRECYIYNQKGQRLRDKAAPTAPERLFRYDSKDRLVQAGSTKIAYDERGNMVSRTQLSSREFETQGLFPQNTRGSLHTFYGEDTRLDRVITPYGTDVRYRYEKESVMPVALYEAEADMDTFRYTWDGLRLKSFYNALEDTRFVFDYQKPTDRLPATATVYIGTRHTTLSNQLHIMLEYNHVGSLVNVFQLLPAGKKRCIKNIEYTAFGIPIRDSAPNFYVPLGFAGGMYDPYTGFVRFGLRDYDAMLGRFTCPDPARDAGRDGDFYDYCSDDPVNYVDVTGLFAVPLLGAASNALRAAGPYAKGVWESAKIAGMGLWGAATAADMVQEQKSGQASQSARKALVDVGPKVAGTVAGSALAGPALAAVIEGAPAAAAFLGQAGAAAGAAAGRAYVHGSEAVARGGKAAADMYERHGVGILEKAGVAKDVVSGYGMPLSAPTTWGEFWGTSVGRYSGEIKSSIDEGRRAVQRMWDESKHPRESNGEFTHK